MKFGAGLTGLLLACSLTGCASLKNSSVDIMYINVHKPEVKEVVSKPEELPWQTRYREFVERTNIPKEEVPPILGDGFARDFYVFYRQHDGVFDFFGDLYDENVKVDVVRVRY